ncbi:SUKH-4 family immunity protein [Streptomyces viridosporus]|uniref:SUKH-4 family immunity protein n=1 Tax=Streptomyces viridosporus TaxID=67581 RepID=UPI0034482BBF
MRSGADRGGAGHDGRRVPGTTTDGSPVRRTTGDGTAGDGRAPAPRRPSGPVPVGPRPPAAHRLVIGVVRLSALCGIPTSTPLPDKALAHVGRDDLRRFGRAGAYGVRLGDDGPAHLCARPDGAVQAVLPGTDEHDTFTNRSLAALNAGLAALDHMLPVIAASSDPSEAAAAFREPDEELHRNDAVAFAERENWWPRVLDDVRHTLHFPFSAAFEYLDDAGREQIATRATCPGQPPRRPHGGPPQRGRPPGRRALRVEGRRRPGGVDRPACPRTGPARTGTGHSPVGEETGSGRAEPARLTPAGARGPSAPPPSGCPAGRRRRACGRSPRS